jgi:hypothetical protein
MAGHVALVVGPPAHMRRSSNLARMAPRVTNA